MTAGHTYREGCQQTLSVQEFTHIAVGPALVIILVLSFLEKRRHAKRCRCCGDRPGLLVPVNLLDGDEDRLAYAAAFGSTATNCLTLFAGDYIPENTPMWSHVFLAMMAVTEMGVDYYPFFACLAKKTSCLWSFIGLVYSVMWLLVNLGHAFECTDASGWLFAGQAVVIQLPVLACLMFLVITFLGRFFKAVVAALTSGISSQEQNSEKFYPFKNEKQDEDITKYYQAQHVSELLKGKLSNLESSHNSTTTDTSIWNILTYRRDPTFHFSPRVTATFTVAVLCLYEFGVLFFLTVQTALTNVQLSLESVNVTRNVVLVVGVDVYRQLRLFHYVTQMSWYTSFGISSVVMLNYIARIFLSYRLEMTRLMRGDYSGIPKPCRELSKSKILAHSLMYSGAQIAYILWGYYVMITAIFLCGILLAYFLILPFLGVVNAVLLEPFWTILPTVAVSYSVYYIQIYVSKKLLLQSGHFSDRSSHKKRRALALDNRRIYHNFSYFLFFYHILLGLYTCLVRVGKGIVLGVVYLGRIDRSGLVNGFEHWDTGYVSYVSFLQVELVHTHPVLVVFCQVVINAARERTLSRHSAHLQKPTASPYSTLVEMEFPADGVSEFPSRARTRWLKAYTLLRNPSLRSLRISDSPLGNSTFFQTL